MADSAPRFLSALVKEHHEALVGFLRIRLGNAEDAAEVAQDAYLRLMKVERLEELANPRAYLFRTATNLAVDRTRQRARQSRQAQQIALQARDNPSRTGTSGSPTPEAEQQARERMQQVADVLEELPDRCRRAFILHRFDGHTHTEIAQELGVSRSMVEKYLIRALDRLRRRLLGNR